MAKMGKVKSCEPRKEFGILLKEERRRQRGLIRDKKARAEFHSAGACEKGSSGCRQTIEEAIAIILAQGQEGEKGHIQILFKGRIKVLKVPARYKSRSPLCPLLICPFITPKVLLCTPEVHHEISHPSSGQSHGWCLLNATPAHAW